MGLAIADNCPDTKVVLGEWSEDALRVCRQNIRRCALTEQVQAAQADALEPPPRLLRDFDLILCNPPYIPTLLPFRVSLHHPPVHSGVQGGLDVLIAVLRQNVFYRRGLVEAHLEGQLAAGL